MNLSDADDCRRICEHGAKKLGYGSYQHYADSEELCDPGSDSEWLSHDLSARAFLHNMNHMKFLVYNSMKISNICIVCYVHTT